MHIEIKCFFLLHTERKEMILHCDEMISHMRIETK